MLPRLKWLFRRGFSSSSRRDVRVAVLGGAGGVGQPLALLLRLNRRVTGLTLYDVDKTTPGVATDVGHIDYPGTVMGYTGEEGLICTLEGAEIVMMTAGISRKPGMSRDDLFATNAGIVRDLTLKIGEVCPKALVAIVTNPVNSVVPIACEVLKKTCAFDCRKVFGVTTLDVVRSKTFIGEAKGLDPRKIKVPVVGGHSPDTIVPLLSRVQPGMDFSQEDICRLTKRIQQAGTEVVTAKAGGGSATLSMAYASAVFANALIRGLAGESNVVECCYLHTDVYPGVSYFANPVCLGPEGASMCHGPGEMSDFECELVEKAVGILRKNIKKGEEFVKQSKQKSKK